MQSTILANNDLFGLNNATTCLIHYACMHIALTSIIHKPFKAMNNEGIDNVQQITLHNQNMLCE
jgi:hypothetical protein